MRTLLMLILKKLKKTKSNHFYLEAESRNARVHYGIFLSVLYKLAPNELFIATCLKFGVMRIVTKLA